jgi:hypothetical protein
MAPLRGAKKYIKKVAVLKVQQAFCALLQAKPQKSANLIIRL